MAQGTLLFLGTGASAGIPVIACDCAVCQSQNPKNKRLRASALIRYLGRNYLIDAGPDVRQQALKFNIKHLDGLLITHSHYDHIGGLEELRIFNFRQKAPIKCLLSHETFKEVKKIFHYIFENREDNDSNPAQIDCQCLNGKHGELLFENLPVRYFSYSQSSMNVTGYRLGDLAYITDIKNYSHDIFSHLEGLNTLVISALRFTSSYLQFSIDDATDFAEKVGAKTTYLMHMSHEIEHEHLQRLLPPTFIPAFDGLEIPFETRST
jgi:phosphoribosyl 1,2-cyclic phosphate phosphodiesterase